MSQASSPTTRGIKVVAGPIASGEERRDVRFENGVFWWLHAPGGSSCLPKNFPSKPHSHLGVPHECLEDPPCWSHALEN